MGKYKLNCQDYIYMKDSFFNYLDGRKTGTVLANITEYSAVSMVPIAALLVFYLERESDPSVAKVLEQVIKFYDYDLEVP